MDDRDLVVVCHCKKHKQLYHIINGDMTHPLGSEVQYVDPECKESTWDKIESNSKLYVYAAFCPVYRVIEFNKNSEDEEWSYSLDTLLHILSGSYRVLENGGKVIFPRASGKSGKTILKVQDLINSIHGIGKWEISFFKENDAQISFPIVAYQEREDVIKDNDIWVWNNNGRLTRKTDAIKKGTWPLKYKLGSFVVFTKIVEGRKKKQRKTRKLNKRR